ncbi:MAG: hypothetical protein WBZ36_14020 [Candidatus Nitrosopolaris sp.]
MLNKFIILTSFMAFVMLAVAATTWVKQEIYARTWTCNPGSHLVTDPNGLPRCAPDTNTTK